jgi:ribose 5-phosphate isomerase B
MSAPAGDGGAAEWVLERLDDNGNTFVLARFTDRETALAAAAGYEARGHKQSYTVRRAVRVVK